jgi:hypothetical protein
MSVHVSKAIITIANVQLFKMQLKRRVSEFSSLSFSLAYYEKNP